MFLFFFTIPLGVFLTFATPAGQVPDETAHIVRADALLHGQFAGARHTGKTPDGRSVASAGVVVDPAIIWASYGPVRPVTAAGLSVKQDTPWTGKPIYVQINPLAVYFPVFYIPSAMGIGLAEIFGASPYETFFVARFASFLAYSCLSLLALMIAKKGQALIFLALSMPMALSLGSSCNPDGLLIATTAVGIALLTQEKRKAAAFCFAAVILVKPPYALMAAALMIALPRLRAWMAARRMLLQRAGIAALTVLPGILWFAYTMADISAPSPHPAYHPGPLWPGNAAVLFYGTDPAAQLQFVLAHPLGSLRLVWRSIVTNPWLVRETIGVLGYQSVVLPAGLYKLWLVGAAGAVVADVAAETAQPVRLIDSLLLLLVILGTVYLIWISQYLNWTEVGMDNIDGPAGRYLLPLIPILGLAVPRLRFGGAVAVRRVAVCLPVLAAFCSLIFLPGWLLVQFYLS